MAKTLAKPQLCTARSKRTGKPCKPHYAIPGGTVCRMHGGGAPQVRRKAKERIDDIIDPDGILRELSAIAKFDFRLLFDANGNAIPLHQLPASVSKVLSGMEVIRGNKDAGDGKWDDVLKPRVWDKTKAIEMLMRYYQMFVEKQQVDQKIEFSWGGDKAE